MMEWIGLGAVVALLAWAVVIYNRLVGDRNRVENAWADIDVQLKRRHDLLPRLVTTVQAYADYEKATLQAVTELRAQSEDAAHLPDKARAEAAIADGVMRLIVVAEDYPELKADANFRELQGGLVEIEDHLQHARRFYNGAVRIFNTRVQSIPDLVIARLCRFREAEFFDAEAAAEAPVTVALKS